jgi:hypothetical protein
MSLPQRLQPHPAEFICAGFREMMSSTVVIYAEQIEGGVPDCFEKKAIESMRLHESTGWFLTRVKNL